MPKETGININSVESSATMTTKRPRGRPKKVATKMEEEKMEEEKVEEPLAPAQPDQLAEEPIAPAESIPQAQSIVEEKLDTPNLDNFKHCFRCGWNEENGAKLVAIANEKICQKCRMN